MKKIIGFIVFFGILAIAFFAYRAGVFANKISTDANVIGSLGRAISLKKERLLAGEDQDRINIVLLGMRGRGDNHGGLLTDTIIVGSYIPSKNGVAMVSIPRDLAINEAGDRINTVYFSAARSGDDAAGMRAVQTVLQTVTGQPIHYVVRANFDGFEQLVDALGGIEITRTTPFVEAIQFHEKRVCNPAAGFSVPVRAGSLDDRYDVKRNEKGKIVAKYPLCYNKNAECGGVFRVGAGTTTLNGAQALCYVRARYSSSDFDRARRQQQVIDAIQQALLSRGTLSDFSKLSALMDVIGDNIKTNMQLWEMQRFFSFYTSRGLPKLLAQTVIDNGPNGLLYTPEGAGENGAAYILRPRGDSYDRIHELFRDIVNQSSDTDDTTTQRDAS